MKAIANKYGSVGLISREEGWLFGKIQSEDFVPVNKLTEREQYLAQCLYERDILDRVKHNGETGFKIYPQGTHQQLKD